MRRYLQRWKENKGFSLVELMVAVGIIGVMSSVAVPKYQKFRAKAAQAEAQATLSSIYTLQQLYFTENDEYVAATNHAAFGTTFNFNIPANARYNYAARIGTHATNGSLQFAGTAISVKRDKSTNVGTAAKLASCAGAVDKWCINQDKILTNTNFVDASTNGPCVTGDIQDGSCK